MLRLNGKVLGVTSEKRQGPTGEFTSNEIHVLDGMKSVAVRVGRDFLPADWPKEGEDVTLEVVCSTFSRRDGSSGIQMTALGRTVEGARALRSTGS